MRMTLINGTFASVADLLRATRPAEPVYCVYPHVVEAAAREFVAGFPGRVLYAVKANDFPQILRPLIKGGIANFDCASLPEVANVKGVYPAAQCYFMTPVRLRGAAREAQSRFGVRHFMVDHLSALAPLADEIDIAKSVVFARMAVSHEAAMQNLSLRFGAPRNEIADLLTAIADAGAEPALAFNVGSAVTSPEAYRYAISVAREVLQALPFRLRLVDIGGGFAKTYPDFSVPPLDEYFAAIKRETATLPLAEGGEILGEPGRALAAPGMSAVVEVVLRKERRLFLNDGMYGIFWELRFNGHKRYSVRCFRDGVALNGETASFRLYGPTCDSTDELPGDVQLPSDIRPGDHLEFGPIGAYSLSGRTNFNGFYSDNIVEISSGEPPSVALAAG
jgi:ornithine decarboxylase